MRNYLILLCINFIKFICLILSKLYEIFQAYQSIYINNIIWSTEFVDTIPIDIPLEECLHYFDQRILSISCLELRELYSLITHINENIENLQRISREGRVLTTQMSSNQAQRIIKLCDLIDKLETFVIPIPLFVKNNEIILSSSDISIVTSFLPDFYSVISHVNKLKQISRLLEEMGFSKKNDNIRFKNHQILITKDLYATSYYDSIQITLFKQEIKSLSHNLEKIETLLSDQSSSLLMILSYFTNLKSNLHKYYLELKSWSQTFFKSRLRKIAISDSLVLLETKLSGEISNLQFLELEYFQARSSEDLKQLKYLMSQDKHFQEQILLLLAKVIFQWDYARSKNILGCLSELTLLITQHLSEDENLSLILPIVNSLNIPPKGSTLQKIIKDENYLYQLSNKNFDQLENSLISLKDFINRMLLKKRFSSAQSEYFSAVALVDIPVEEIKDLWSQWKKLRDTAVNMMLSENVKISYKNLINSRKRIKKAFSLHEMTLSEYFHLLEQEHGILKAKNDFQFRYFELAKSELSHLCFPENALN